CSRMPPATLLRGEWKQPCRASLVRRHLDAHRCADPALALAPQSLDIDARGLGRINLEHDLPGPFVGIGSLKVREGRTKPVQIVGVELFEILARVHLPSDERDGERLAAYRQMA